MFISQSQYIGVESGKTHLRVAAMRKTRQGWVLSSYKEISGQDGIDLFCAQFKEAILVSSLNSRDILMRPCEMPLKKTKDIFSALKFHIEPLLPYPVEKAIVQAQIAGKLEKTSLMNIFAVRKDRLSQHLEQLNSNHLDPEIITTRPHALAALAAILPRANGTSFIVHEAEEEITFILLEKGTILAVRSIDNKKEIGTEIQKTLLSFAATHKNKMGEAIYFLGRSEEIKSALQAASGKAVLYPSSPFPTLKQEDFIQFSLAIGSAIAHSEVNFRQNEFAYPRPFRRLKKPLLTFISLTLLLAASLYTFGEISLARKKEGLQTSYYKLLKTNGISDHGAMPVTLEEYESALAAIDKEICAKPDTFPLLPQIPKVKEVVSWLTALSRAQGKEGGAITIESIHYQLVKHPDFAHKNEKYKVRVDLELSAKDLGAARAFQEALRESSSLADSNEEVQWLPIKGKYKVSFFLKDKTKYK